MSASIPPSQYPQPPVPHRRGRTLLACSHCRKQKIRCITTEQPPLHPCARCVKRKLTCTYVAVPDQEVDSPPDGGHPHRPGVDMVGSEPELTLTHPWNAHPAQSDPSWGYASSLGPPFTSSWTSTPSAPVWNQPPMYPTYGEPGPLTSNWSSQNPHMSGYPPHYSQPQPLSPSPPNHEYELQAARARQYLTARRSHPSAGSATAIAAQHYSSSYPLHYGDMDFLGEAPPEDGWPPDAGSA
ncbi:hypothetical protein DFH09DRAFT_1439689 [Mycena vulgaris]|nr:hypothetical protein DFH09DRAFT_1439689 [Mycena vulgaris]